MDWDKLRVFHAVAEAGSLTHAGESLRLSQSAVSRQIRALEEALGATLFHRHARGLILTEQGELLFDATKEMQRKLVAAGARIRDSKDEVFGELRVTTTVGFGAMWLTPRLGRFFDLYPDLSIDLLATENVLDLPMREADVAIRMREPQQAELIRRPLFDVHMRFYASESYIAKHGAPQTAESLRGHRMIGYSPNAQQPTPVGWWLNGQLAANRATLLMNNYFSMLQAVEAGLGVAALPDYLASDHSELQVVAPSLHSPAFTVYFAYPEELRRSRRVEAFRDFIFTEVEALREGR
ncbi:MAG: LysR family transcriptional regulator [Paracoccaceae bacterium]|jgi:DNA-binding transcriptional LysR family regulator|nr:LysR family transcriptional regulator [Paracoccaceae bacterium]